MGMIVSHCEASGIHVDSFFVLTSCMSQSFRVYILHAYCMSLEKNDPGSD